MDTDEEGEVHARPRALLSEKKEGAYGRNHLVGRAQEGRLLDRKTKGKGTRWTDVRI